ncbi:Ldh family oxidoreductase [Streptomyces sp. M10(2022)]
MAKLRGGRLTARPKMTRRPAGAGCLVLDADRAPGPLAVEHAVSFAATRASRQGVALVVVRNAGHAGALGVGAAQLARRGLVGCWPPRRPGRAWPYWVARGQRCWATRRWLWPFRYRPAAAGAAGYGRRAHVLGPPARACPHRSSAARRLRARPSWAADPRPGAGRRPTSVRRRGPGAGHRAGAAGRRADRKPALPCGDEGRVCCAWPSTLPVWVPAVSSPVPSPKSPLPSASTAPGCPANAPGPITTTPPPRASAWPNRIWPR